MPTYFGPVAPYCPVSRDSPVGPSQTPVLPIATTIPRATDLPSAITAVNLLRTIVINLVVDRVINNVHTPPPNISGNKERTSRWKQGRPVKRKYKYYAVDPATGEKDKDVWVMTERIESLTWADSAWRTSLNFTYGYKGDDGEPVGGGAAGTTGQDYALTDDGSGDYNIGGDA